MKPTVITFKTDPETKEAAQGIAEEMGLNLSVVMNALLKDFVRDRSLRIDLDPSEAADIEKGTHTHASHILTQTTEHRPERPGSEMILPLWHTTTVIHGDKTGRTLGFPTANLDMRLMDTSTRHGVWAAEVKIGKKLYLGALYYGPRLVKGEHHIVLEIHILDFDGELYDEQIWFRLVQFVRGVLDFDDLEALKLQLQEDCSKVREAFRS